MLAQSIPAIVMASITFAFGAFVFYLFLRRRRAEDLSFAWTCLAVVAYDIAAAGDYSSATPLEALDWQRAQVTAIALVGLALIRFVADYTRQVHALWKQVLTAYFGLTALLTVWLPRGLNWDLDHPSIKHVRLPWGLSVTYQEIAPGVPVQLHSLFGTLAVIYMLFATGRAYRTGRVRRMKPLLWALGLFALTFLNDVLVNSDVYTFLYLTEYGYLGLVLLVVFAIATELVEAGVLKAEREVLEEQLRQAAKMEAIGRLAGGVAHDLNNQLTPILGYSEVALGRKTLSPDLRVFFEQIRDAGEHARDLTQQLLTFGRKQALRMRTIDLNPIVSGSQMMLRRVIPENIEVRLALDPRLGSVRGDITQLRQILFNLVLNARDAMPEGGRLEISTANAELGNDQTDIELRAGSYVVLGVRDSGIGIDPTTRAKIFDPFFTTKHAYQNSGLGLATVAGIVKQHGGRIRVESTPGEGALFQVFLPRVQANPESLERKPVSSPGARRGALVLVVEDEPAVRRLAERVLMESGFSVLVAESPGAAQKLAREHADRLSLLLTDMVMPEMGGPDLYRVLSQSLPGLPVLYMTGYPDRVASGDGPPGAPGRFLAKPFSASELVQAVEETLAAQPTPRA